jgi:hypothetical protein
MLDFVCDTCSAVKEPEESWIVGLAAEAVGAVSARREVNLQSAWTREAAIHPLAVHFCSIQCKDEYLARLFGTQPAEEVVVESAVPGEVIVEREVPAKVVTTTRRVRRNKRQL